MADSKPRNPAATRTVAAVTKGTTEMTTKTENEVKNTANEIKKNADAATERAQAAFGEMSERSKVAMDKGNRMMEEMTEFTKGNVEAIVASSRVAAKGAEQLTREAAEFGRKRVETATATMKSFASAKSPTEVFQLQSDYARGAFDAMVAESSKMSEAWLKVASEAFEPITNRYAVAADKAREIAA